MTGAPPPTASARWAPFAWPIAAALVAALLFAPTLGFHFAYDDRDYVVRNPHVLAPSRLLESIVEPFSPQQPEYGLWRPTATFSLQLDALGAARVPETFLRWTGEMPDPRPFHQTNILLHALATVLVFLVARRCLGAQPAAASGAAALLFAVHPVHVEVVANVTGRAELLTTIGYLAAWLCLDVLLVARTSASLAVRRMLALGMLAFLALALGAKETAVTFPLMLAATAWMRGALPWSGRAQAASAREAPLVASSAERWAVPLLFVAAVATILAFVLCRTAVTGYLTVPDRISYFGERPELSRAWAAPFVFLFNLRLLAIPAAYYPDYNFPFPFLGLTVGPISGPDSPWAWLGLVAAAALYGALALGLWRRSAWAWGLAWWLLPLTLFLHIIPFGDIAGDRFLYLPSVGFCLLAGGGFGSLAARRGRAVALAAAGALLLPFAARTLAQMPHWRDDRAHWSWVATDPHNIEGIVGLASVDKWEGIALSIRLARAAEQWPAEERQRAKARRLEVLADAERRFREALDREPGHLRATIGLAETIATRDAARSAEARTLLAEAYHATMRQDLKGHHIIARMIATSLLAEQKGEEALPWARRAVAMNDGSDLAEAREALGEALRQRAVATLQGGGDPAAGMRMMEEAVREVPEYWKLRFNFAEMLEQAGRPEAALAHWRELARRHPDRSDFFQRARALEQVLARRPPPRP